MNILLTMHKLETIRLFVLPNTSGHFSAPG